MKSRSTSVPITPYALGTGLVALDVVVKVDSPAPPPCYAGGTCGNVLSILSYLGWRAAPISRLAPGPATEWLLADLANWQVSTEFISVDGGGSTPIIIERIGQTAGGEPYHTFSWRCPGCGAHLPGHKPVLATTVQELIGRLPTCRVFFLDRVSRGALNLAEAVSENGALVVFEPSGVGEPNLFREAWNLAHIVKYSHQRLRDIADLELTRSEREHVLLEVETLGADGLRYRSRLPKSRTVGWRGIGPFKPRILRDAAGSGDWCTAGILNKLARGGLRGFRSANAGTLEMALRYGQALAAWNCGFEGARGGMYQVNRPTFEKQVEEIQKGGEAAPVALDEGLKVAARLLGCFCPSCKNMGLGPISRSANTVKAV